MSAYVRIYLCDLLGIAVDGDNEDAVIIKQVGKVAALRKLVDEHPFDFDKPFISHCGMVSSIHQHMCVYVFLLIILRLIPVGLLTVNLHKSTLTLNAPIPLMNSLLYTMVSLPTIRKSSFYSKRRAMSLKAIPILNVLSS